VVLEGILLLSQHLLHISCQLWNPTTPKQAHQALAGTLLSVEEVEVARVEVVAIIEQCMKVVWLAAQLGSWEAAKAQPGPSAVST
jgi:hypothetical protein